MVACSTRPMRSGVAAAAVSLVVLFAACTEEPDEPRAKSSTRPTPTDASPLPNRLRHRQPILRRASGGEPPRPSSDKRPRSRAG